MGKLVVFIATSIGGAVGWWLGAMVGTMTAFILSMVGTGVGLYAARRWLARYVD